MSEKEKCRKGFAATSLISNLGHAYHVMVVMSHDMHQSNNMSFLTYCVTCHIYYIYICYAQHKCSLLIENGFSTRYNIQHVT